MDARFCTHTNPSISYQIYLLCGIESRGSKMPTHAQWAPAIARSSVLDGKIRAVCKLKYTINITPFNSFSCKQICVSSNHYICDENLSVGLCVAYGWHNSRKSSAIFPHLCRRLTLGVVLLWNGGHLSRGRRVKRSVDHPSVQGMMNLCSIWNLP